MDNGFQNWFENFSKEHIDPNELSANAFGLIVWEHQQEKIDTLERDNKRLSKSFKSQCASYIKACENNGVYVSRFQQQQKIIQVLKEAVEFYGDYSSWDYGKEWNQLKEVQLFHAIKRPSNKWDDFEVAPAKAKLLDKYYPYLCAGKKAREALKQVEELENE